MCNVEDQDDEDLPRALQHCCNCSRPWHRYIGAASTVDACHVLTHLWRAAACLDFVWYARRSFWLKWATVLELLPALSRAQVGLELKDDAARAIWPATDHPRDPNLDAVVRCAPHSVRCHSRAIVIICFACVVYTMISVVTVVVCRYIALIRPPVSRKREYL